MSSPKLVLTVKSTYDSNSRFDYAGDIEVIYPSEEYNNTVVELRVGNYQLIIGIDELSRALDIVKALKKVLSENE